MAILIDRLVYISDFFLLPNPMVHLVLIVCTSITHSWKMNTVSSLKVMQAQLCFTLRALETSSGRMGLLLLCLHMLESHWTTVFTRVGGLYVVLFLK